MRILLFENFDKSRKKFTDSEINYWKKLWNGINVKYHQNKFYSSIWNSIETKKEISQRQWSEMEFLLKNGKGRYESGVLPTKF